MAKAQKKTLKDDTETRKKPTAAATAPVKKAAAKKPSAPAATGAPLIDTNLAASAAAAMILNRAVTGAGGAPAQPAKKESASFKNLKDSLSKPTSQGLVGNFGNIGAQKKSGQNFGGGKQVGRNQTFGADVNRTGVPRRTGGG
jgi:hypothetical protein